MIPFAVATGVLVLALIVAERREAANARWLLKPAASTCFVGVALAGGALQSDYGLAVLAALVLSWLGDVFLIPRRKLAFLLGIGAFLLGHVAYSAAFLIRGVSAGWSAAAALPLLAVAFLVGRWLLPRVPAGMKAPVLAYIVVICSMVALAAGTVAAWRCYAILAGAVAFFCSDLSVARDRFVHPAFVNRLWGLPLYYGAQVVLASTVATC